MLLANPAWYRDGLSKGTLARFLCCLYCCLFCLG